VSGGVPSYPPVDALRHIWAAVFLAWGKSFEMAELETPAEQRATVQAEWIVQLKELVREHVLAFAADDPDQFSDGRPTYAITALIGQADYVRITHPDLDNPVNRGAEG
jgi:hypothetical protein